jgi:hypothetical protein
MTLLALLALLADPRPTVEWLGHAWQVEAESELASQRHAPSFILCGAEVVEGGVLCHEWPVDGPVVTYACCPAFYPCQQATSGCAVMKREQRSGVGEVE